MDPGHVASLAVLDTLSLHSTIRSKLALQLVLVYSFTSMSDTILAGFFFLLHNDFGGPEGFGGVYG